MIFGIFATLAEFERSLIVERVRSGLAAARARGQTLGRPRQACDVDRIVSLRAQGLSWRAIAATLGVKVTTAREAWIRRTENVENSRP
jgi:DNA invertase Pin-like site-specific DNA recombinase